MPLGVAVPDAGDRDQGAHQVRRGIQPQSDQHPRERRCRVPHQLLIMERDGTWACRQVRQAELTGAECQPAQPVQVAGEAVASKRGPATLAVEAARGQPNVAEVAHQEHVPRPGIDVVDEVPGQGHQHLLSDKARRHGTRCGAALHELVHLPLAELDRRGRQALLLPVHDGGRPGRVLPIPATVGVVAQTAGVAAFEPIRVHGRVGAGRGHDLGGVPQPDRRPHLVGMAARRQDAGVPRDQPHGIGRPGPAQAEQQQRLVPLRIARREPRRRQAGEGAERHQRPPAFTLLGHHHVQRRARRQHELGQAQVEAAVQRRIRAAQRGHHIRARDGQGGRRQQDALQVELDP